MRYFGISVFLPIPESENYRNFVLPDGRIYQKERPTFFERELPGDWKLYGASRSIPGRVEVVTAIDYEFTSHPDQMLS